MRKIINIAITTLMLIGGILTMAPAQQPAPKSEATSGNLVPNPSFEKYDSCFPDLTYVHNWYNPTGGSPDYFNACDTVCCGVPQNAVGYELARTGNAYVGLITFSDSLSGLCSADNPWREYLQVKLLDSLKNGNQYCISFFVSMGDSNNIAANDIGVYFSNKSDTNSSWMPLNYSPQITNSPITNPLTKKIGWIKIADTLIAEGGEKYITIGNFKYDGNTDTSYVGGAFWGGYCSYYYLDDVSVVPCDTINNIHYLSPREEKLTVFSSSSGIYNISFPKGYKVMQIYNISGQVVFSKNVSENKIQVNLGHLDNGIYFISLMGEDKKLVRQFFIY